ncbi:MAG: DUF3429 domain-containing protein [Pseudomonadota bacterium]
MADPDPMLRPGAFSIPIAPLALTLAGLVPFVASAAVMVWAGDDPENAVRAGQAGFVVLAYGAVILSFLGGVRWGAEMAGSDGSPPASTVLLGSVAGALVGWGALLVALLNPFFPVGTLFLGLAAALTLHWAWDVSSRAAGLPAWYGGLRTLATAGAVLSLLAAWSTV